MPEQIQPAERLLNLVIALVHTPGRMTKEQIRRTVAGYGDAASDEAFERMFERDKDTLRELGIPVTTVTAAGHGDDIGYRVDQDAYALPPLELTAAELGALSLAAEFWQDRSVRADTSRALTKLRAVGAGSGATDLAAGLVPRVRAGGDAFRPLLDAVQARQRVRFTYRAANTGEVRERLVEPWRLVARRGGWFLVGRDVDRAAPRSYRLSRIEGRVRPDGDDGAFDPPATQQMESALRSWDAGQERTAVLALRPERAEALRARGSATALPADADPALRAVVADRDLVRVPYRATWELAEEVAGYGDAVLVADPPALRAAVLRLLRSAAALAGPDAGAGPGTGEDGRG
ncbi:WYL domain-containing protein [Cellulomonas sp. ES6]|uniref:helix-turn-helix transcriptional regulator n=1 Tax=Cellulomonas sp. ES6 TaxID=3039384 RepID=UPI0024B81B4B|nr:WYL domain-containing protein [Cellulomonas sp. ES6]WHP17815.1 WYL domain-containing protein [Cellulomonas sp. ES6]